MKQPTSDILCCKFFFFFGHAGMACRISVPWPGIEPRPQHWKPRILTTRPPGNSLLNFKDTVKCQLEEWEGGLGRPPQMAQKILFWNHKGNASRENLKRVHALVQKGWAPISWHAWSCTLEQTREGRDLSSPSPRVSPSQRATQLQGWRALCVVLMLSILLLRKG